MSHLLTLIFLCFLVLPSHGKTVEWIVKSSAGQTGYLEAASIIRAVDTYSKMYQVPEDLIWRVMYVESRFVKSRVSHKNAKGLMQVVEKWHPEKVQGVPNRDLFQISSNVKVGTQILSEYLKRYGSVDKALHAYNGLYGRKDEYAKLVKAVRLPVTSEQALASYITPKPKVAPQTQPKRPELLYIAQAIPPRKPEVKKPTVTAQAKPKERVVKVASQAYVLEKTARAVSPAYKVSYAYSPRHQSDSALLAVALLQPR